MNTAMQASCSFAGLRVFRVPKRPHLKPDFNHAPTAHRRNPLPRPRRPDRARWAAGAHRRRVRRAAAVGTGARLPHPPAHHPGAAGVAGVGQGRVRPAAGRRVAVDAGAVPGAGRRGPQGGRFQPPEDALRPRAGAGGPLRKPGPGRAGRARRWRGPGRAGQGEGYRPLDRGHLPADGPAPAGCVAGR